MADRDRQGLRAILAVAAIAVCAAGLISASHEISAERIERNTAERLMRSLHEVLDPSLYDNDLVRTQVWAIDPDLLGTPDPVQVFLATRDGQPAAAIFAAVAPRGYNGRIDLLVGIDAQGVVQGVRVAAHRETPGLGDRIEISVSDWITAFDGTSLSDPPLSQWAVVADGGRFDAFTGATVTPRAVVQAVRDALVYFDEHQAELFARAAAAGDVGTDPEGVGTDAEGVGTDAEGVGTDAEGVDTDPESVDTDPEGVGTDPESAGAPLP